MTVTDIFFIGVGLSMDALAVAMCQGVSMKKLRMRSALLVALFFGGFQLLMPLAGFALGSTFASFVTIGPWIAAALLLIIGGKMLIDGIRDKNDEPTGEIASLGRVLLLAIATSIDAFAVGVGFSMQEGIVWLHGGISIFFAVTLIGCTTFILSLFGVWVGNRFGLRYHRLATIIGGIVLISIGTKMILEALGILPAFLRCDGSALRDAAAHILWL